MSEDFRAILKERARGSSHLGPLAPETCERAMDLILSGGATEAQIGGFLLVGRAVGDTPEEIAGYARALGTVARRIEAPPGPPVVTVAGGFDGKLRTSNAGAVASLVAAAAGGRNLLVGCEGTPPKEGRTVFDALRNIGVAAPQGLEESGELLAERGFAATSVAHYLPELHDLLGLRRELVRRTVLNVVEKLVSPIRGSRPVVGVSHRPYLALTASALVRLGVRDALVVQAIEGSDEAPLDGTSAVVAVRDGRPQELRLRPEDLGLSRATRTHLAWRGEEDEREGLLAALDGERGPVRDLVLYNAALRLWVADWETPLGRHLERAASAVDSGATTGLVERLRGRRLAGIREG